MTGPPSGRLPDLCIVVPAYNEEGNIPVLVAELDAAMSSAAIDYHVLFVDDGSHDRTRKVLLELVASNPRVSAALLSRNFGHQAAVSAGLMHARGKAVAVMDADLQDRPEDVVALYRAWEAGADVAYGVRRSRREGVFLRFLYKAFYRLLSSIANVKIPLDSGDFCVMDRAFVDRLNALPERQRYVRGLRAWLGGVQEPVPVDRDARRSGKPQYTMAALARLAVDGFVSFSFVPLRLATYAGGVVSALAFGGMGIVLGWRLTGDLPSGSGLATIALSVLFLGGVQLISIGIMGEYIGRIFDEVKARPVAVVGELRGAICGWQENEVNARSGRYAVPPSRSAGLCATKAETQTEEGNMKTRNPAAIAVLVAVLFAGANQVGAATLYVSQTSPNPSPPYATWETAAQTIQEAVDAASDGDTVLVAPDQYGLTNQVTVAKAIALRSTMGAGQTFLNSLGNNRCLWMSNSLAVVDGFTIRGRGDGSDQARGVVMIGGVLSNCVVRGGAGPWRLGRLVDCSGGGLITDCNMDGESRTFAAQGAGVYLIDSELRNSTISGMWDASEYGGAFEGAGVYAVASTISGCTITGNWARRAGGGAYFDGCTVDRCIVSGNTAGLYLDAAGRGGGVFTINSVILSSLIAGNRASSGYDPETGQDGGLPGFGGGIYLSGGSLFNCTATGNGASHGGGTYVESGNVRNSIVYFNSASSNANWYNVGAGSYDHTCTTPDPGGFGNIAEDPQFVDRTNGNYRLAATSPCIDAGVNESWMSGVTDLDGNPRIANGTVDLGAWERPPVPVVTWIAPTNGSSFPARSNIRMSARATDPDGSVSFVEFFANSTNLGQVVSATDVYDFVWSNAPSGPFRLHAEAVDNEGGRAISSSVLIVVGATGPAATFGNPSPDGYDAFGNSVAISGTYLVVGTDVHNPGAAESGGAAYVYDLASATPTTPAVILANPSPGIDVFGWSVAISGTYVVVGAPFDDTGAGRAYVYDLASAAPTVPVATPNNPTPEVSDRFGWSVAISGTLVVVGAHGDGTGAQRAGSAYVYDMASVTPTVPVATLNNPSPGAGDVFGVGLAISGTRVVVAAPGDDNTAVNDGTVYVYDLTSATPTAPVLTFTNPNPTTARDGFGSSVAISGTRVVVGDTRVTDAPIEMPIEPGSVYVYDLASATPGEPVITLDNPAPMGPHSDYFGWSVAISGTRVVVGAYHHEVDQTGAPRAGSTYVYELASATPTVPVATLNNPSPATDDRFGYSVGVSGARVLVGARNDDSGAAHTGSAYLYDFASASHPVVQFAPPQVNNGIFRSMIGVLPEQGTIIVETSSDLINWQPLQTNTVSGASFELVVPISRSNPAQFWRALVQY